MDIEELERLKPSMQNPVTLECNDERFQDRFNLINVISPPVKNGFAILDNYGYISVFPKDFLKSFTQRNNSSLHENKDERITNLSIVEAVKQIEEKGGFFKRAVFDSWFDLDDIEQDKFGLELEDIIAQDWEIRTDEKNPIKWENVVQVITRDPNNDESKVYYIAHKSTLVQLKFGWVVVTEEWLRSSLFDAFEANEYEKGITGIVSQKMKEARQEENSNQG